MKIVTMIGHLIRRMNQVSTQHFVAHTAQAGLEITPVQFAALDALQAFPGLDQAGMAVRIACDRATAGGVIDRLVSKGLVERVVSPHDRRARDLRLTTQGMAVYRELLPLVLAAQTALVSGLEPEERQTLINLLAKALATSPLDRGEVA